VQQPAPAQVEPAPPAPAPSQPVLSSQISKLIWLRTGASFQAKAIERLRPGTKIQVLKRQDRWGEITTGRRRGWVPLFAIKGERVPKAAPSREELRTRARIRKVPVKSRRWRLFDL
jgi:hypothetical protein